MALSFARHILMYASRTISGGDSYAAADVLLGVESNFAILVPDGSVVPIDIKIVPGTNLPAKNVKTAGMRPKSDLNKVTFSGILHSQLKGNAWPSVTLNVISHYKIISTEILESGIDDRNGDETGSPRESGLLGRVETVYHRTFSLRSKINSGSEDAKWGADKNLMHGMTPTSTKAIISLKVYDVLHDEIRAVTGSTNDKFSEEAPLNEWEKMNLQQHINSN